MTGILGSYVGPHGNRAATERLLLSPDSGYLDSLDEQMLGFEQYYSATTRSSVWPTVA
jgi:hypothetical protein